MIKAIRYKVKALFTSEDKNSISVIIHKPPLFFCPIRKFEFLLHEDRQYTDVWKDCALCLYNRLYTKMLKYICSVSSPLRSCWPSLHS